MKKAIFAILLLSVFTVACNPNGGNKTTDIVTNPATASNESGKENQKISEIKWLGSAYEFGVVTDGEKVKHDFKFVNVGDAPLIIAGAQASCGCTIPEWPREPIAPGDTGVINVEFNSKGRVGTVQKQITVTANTNPSISELALKGEVRPAEVK
jgi:Protein of unknown function (DUF1573)